MIFSQKSNYVLISAVDGKEAVERAKREKPDLILMDIVMPRMTGLEACRVPQKGQGDREDSRHPADYSRRRTVCAGRLCQRMQRLPDETGE